MASGLPVVTLREDFDGVEGVWSEEGLEECLEVFGYGYGWDVGYLYCESGSCL